MSDYGCDFPSALVAAELRPLIVIRVNYNDITFQSNAATWSAKIFGTNNHQLNHYYETISKGRFGFAKAVETDGAADGVITVALDKNHPDYDINNNDDFLNNFQPDISAALSETDAFINYSQYDKNHNGVITPDELIVMFILAGNEDAFSGNNASAGVWAHQSCVSPANAPTLDGVSLMGCLGGGNYAVFGERHVDQSINYNHDATIGIIAHELGHAAFTLPDLYDTSGASAGIGYFGLMGSGLWGRASAADLYGNTPVQMTAWSKLHNGWIVPEVVLDTPYADLTFYDTASADYNIALFPIGEAQCFLVENRSTSGYDAGLNDINSYYKGGLAIWHIDQDVINADTLTNTVNADAAHKGVDLEEAAYAGLDGSATFPGDAHNLFWLGNKTAFTSATNPSSKQYDGGDSGVAVTGIDEANPVMHAVAANPNKVVTP